MTPKREEDWGQILLKKYEYRLKIIAKFSKSEFDTMFMNDGSSDSLDSDSVSWDLVKFIEKILNE